MNGRQNTWLLLILQWTLLWFISPANGQDLITVKSPDGRISMLFQIKNGTLQYAVTVASRNLVQSAQAMGFSFQNAAPFQQGLAMKQVKSASVDQPWQHPTGSNGMVLNRYNETTIDVFESAVLGRKLTMVARAYDDGVAFRFKFPEGFCKDSLLITKELTSFKFELGDSAFWASPNDFAYESLYRFVSTQTMASASTPVTIKKNDGIWMALHEAELVDYSEMFLSPLATDSNAFETALHPWPDGVACRAQGIYQTPWRCIMIQQQPGGLLTSNLLLNLNPPSAISDLTWVKPIRFVGIWWGMHIGKYTWSEGPHHGATTKRAMQYIDFAASNGIEGVLVEGWNKGWETWAANQIPVQNFTASTTDFNLEEVANYARSKGVELIGHHETGGNIPEYEKQMEAAFALCQRLGIRYVKTGYAGSILPEGMHHHGQYMVRHFQKVVELAAKYRICLDVHESIKPTGLERTWPNLLSQEAVRGNEWNATYKSNPPAHAVTLPFTRGLAGPFDYTPGIFKVMHSAGKNKRVPTMITHQLAQCVVFNSPMLMFADQIENYQGHPLTTMLAEIQAAWDTTIVLDALPGKHMLIARRHQDDWMVAGLSGNGATNTRCQLSFLDQNQSYQAKLIFDTPLASLDQQPEKYDTVSFIVNHTDTIPINMLPGGGFVMLLEPSANDNSISPERLRYRSNAPKVQRIFAARKTYGDMREPHLAVGKAVKRFQPFNEQYPAAGAAALNDGVRGGYDFSDGGWQGYWGTGVDISIDLGYVDTVSRVKVGFLEAQSSWIFFPDAVELSYSKDGVMFQNVKRLLRPNEVDITSNEHRMHEFDFSGMELTARFIRIRTNFNSICPKGHPGEGKPSWMFADEVMVYRK